MEIQFTTRIFREGRTYVAHALELDVSSCGGTKEKALKNLKEAVRLFLEEAEQMGTLDPILEESGLRQTEPEGHQTEVRQRATRDSRAPADACQSSVLIRINSL